MANESYNSEVAPNTFLRKDEEDQGLITSTGGIGPPVRRRGRSAGSIHGRDKLTMANIKASMAGYWKENHTYAEIAERVNEEYGFSGEEMIKPAGVHYHIKSLLDTARKNSMLHINERQALALARLDQLEMLCMEAYFASTQGKNTIHNERIIKMAKSKEREKQIAEDLKRERKRIDKKNLKRKAQHKPLLKYPNEPEPIIGDGPELLIQTGEHLKEISRTEEVPSGDPRFLSMVLDIQQKRNTLWGLLNRSDISNPDQDLAKLPDEERRSRMAAVLHAAMTRRHEDKGALAPPSPLGGFAEGQEPTVAEQVKMATPEQVEESESEVEWEFD